MSTEFPINFRLNAHDSASAALGSIISVLKEGRGASESTKSSFAAFRNEILYQNTALRTLNTTFRVSYFEILTVGRALSSVGAVGHTLLGIVNSINIAQLANLGVASDLRKATDDVADATLTYRQVLVNFPADSVQALEALAKLHTAQNDLKDATDKANTGLTTQATQFAGIGLSIVQLLGQLALAVPAMLKVLGTVPTASEFVAFMGSLKGVAGAFAVIGLAMAVVEQGFDPILVSAKKFAEDFDKSLVFKGFVALGKLVVDTVGVIVDAFTDAQTKLGKIWETMVAIATSVWGSLGPIIKTALNVVIWWVNTFIAVIDNMINAYNAIAAKIFLPTLPLIPPIPTLAEGGIVTEPTLALIGERGPEAVVPLDRGGGVGGNINVNVWVYGSVVTENQLTNDIARNMYLMLTRIARR